MVNPFDETTQPKAASDWNKRRILDLEDTCLILIGRIDDIKPPPPQSNMQPLELSTSVMFAAGKYQTILISYCIYLSIKTPNFFNLKNFADKVTSCTML